MNNLYLCICEYLKKNKVLIIYLDHVQYFSFADYTIYCNVFQKPIWLLS